MQTFGGLPLWARLPLPPSQEPCLVIPPARELRAKAGRWHQQGKASELSSRAPTPPLLLLSCLCPTRGSCAATLHTVGAKVSAFSTRFFINIFSFFLSTVSLATSISQYALRWICLTTHVYIFLSHFFFLNCGADGVFGTYPAINPHLTNEETEI